MSFSGDVRRFAARVETNSQRVFVGTATTALESIQTGSAITGAPGQPVDTGNLRASWQLTFPDPTHAEITTKVEYAEDIEDGVGAHGPITLRSAVGGFHSVKLTVAGLARIVEAETAKVAR